MNSSSILTQDEDDDDENTTSLQTIKDEIRAILTAQNNTDEGFTIHEIELLYEEHTGKSNLRDSFDVVSEHGLMNIFDQDFDDTLTMKIDYNGLIKWYPILSKKSKLNPFAKPYTGNSAPATVFTPVIRKPIINDYWKSNTIKETIITSLNGCGINGIKLGRLKKTYAAITSSRLVDDLISAKFLTNDENSGKDHALYILKAISDNFKPEVVVENSIIYSQGYVPTDIRIEKNRKCCEKHDEEIDFLKGRIRELEAKVELLLQ